ncbi:MAG TPA: LysR family transcriptional regulator, partial [Streptosporangiaceae bacterium]|nr:LysR family transcriptional regulator [Streptosporangiaceae bacterium]
MDVDLRKLRYFAAVARHRNFSRAAQELHIAQPVLSRQIRALESELGAVLFVRDRNGAQLTPAGTQLALEAEPLLAAAEALRRRVAQAARKAGQFTVAFMPGLIVTGPVRAFGDAHPELTVEVLRTSRADQ